MKTAFINLRMFSHPWTGENKKEHSYYVRHDPGGLSGPMDTIAVDLANCSFLQLRDQIQEQNNENTMRRRPFFNEFVHFMQRCPNPLDYDGEATTMYRLGVIKMKDEKGFVPGVEDIRVIRTKDEQKFMGDEIGGDFLGTDVVLIPRTQIHPITDRLTDKL